ncbi:hypothetical protein COLO4_36401 [Corchorus olitorius]|uniref:Uncharacterized protein n=1 Tax=Corchorus olitorius TaxID=93759 RepID=A0A1R3G997_9ROSI|nr:hypothetical protein COLO4_36401 [Corchorus olitorius]
MIATHLTQSSLSSLGATPRSCKSSITHTPHRLGALGLKNPFPSQPHS